MPANGCPHGGGSWRNLGAAAIIMCQADRHYKPAFGDFMVEQFVGWVLAHDCLPESNLFWPVLAGESEMWHEGIRFLPYWKAGSPVSSRTCSVNRSGSPGERWRADSSSTIST